MRLSSLLPKWAPAQRDVPELLDTGRAPVAEVKRSLDDLRRINTYLGGNAPACDGIWRLVEASGLRSVSVLDIGTGGADIPRLLVRQAQRRNIDLTVTGLDIMETHLRIAAANLARSSAGEAQRIKLVRGDAFRLPFADGSFDIVTATLFLHHFRPPQIQALLDEFTRVARRGIVINDIERAFVPLWSFRLVRPIFARSYLTRFDGEASLRRAYTAAEMWDMLRGRPRASLEELFPYRFRVIIDTGTPGPDRGDG